MGFSIFLCITVTLRFSLFFFKGVKNERFLIKLRRKKRLNYECKNTRQFMSLKRVSFYFIFLQRKKKKKEKKSIFELK